jgi:hypothetical protein
MMDALAITCASYNSDAWPVGQCGASSRTGDFYEQSINLFLILGAFVMSTGFNSNVEVGGAVYHVQTEDRGLNHPFVDTVVLSGGQVVYRRSVGYKDLLGDAGLNESVLGARIEQQHREILEGVRAGLLPLEERQPMATALRLCNPTSGLVAGRASLEIEVLSRPERRPVAGADVQVSIEGLGEGESSQFSSLTDASGRARLRFPMPSLADHPNPTLVIGVRGTAAKDQLRYRLKPKPRDPAPPAR